MKQSISKPINRSVNQPINQSIESKCVTLFGQVAGGGVGEGVLERAATVAAGARGDRKTNHGEM